MRKQTIYILFSLLLGISLVLFIFIRKNPKITSPDKQVIVKVYGNDKNLVCLEIFDKNSGKKEIKNTRSSIYQGYKINFLDNDNFLFDSSDTGCALFKRGKKQWDGMRAFAFSSLTREFIAILLPEQELMKQTDGIDRNGDDFKDRISYLGNGYKLLVFGNGKSMHLPIEKWHHFSMNNPPHKAIEWQEGGNFILQEKDNRTVYIIEDGKILEKAEVKK